MAKQIVTANRLVDGLVVYMGSSGWTEQVAEAAVAETGGDAVAILERATLSVDRCQVVDPYLIEVETSEAEIRPVRYREVVRAFGPSVPFGQAALPQQSA